MHHHPVHTVVALTVPEAQPLVEQVRAAAGARAHGMPAHVTLLGPFVPEPDVGVVEELRYFFAGVDAFGLTFSSVGEFPDVVYLAPDQAEECAALTAALARRWPDHPPYEGRFAQVVPHLTVVESPDPDVRARSRELLEGRLPVTAMAAEASLWAREPGGWRAAASFPLAAAEPD